MLSQVNFLSCIFRLILTTTDIFAADTPSLEIRTLSPNELRITGKNFPDRRMLLVELDLNTPHASVACSTDWSRIIAMKGKTFDIFMAISPRSGCGNIKWCRANNASDYMITVDDWENRTEIARLNIPCGKGKS